MSASRGRPKSDNPKTERLFVRVTPEEKANISNFCKENEVTISDLVKVGIDTTIKEKAVRPVKLTDMVKNSPVKLSDRVKNKR